MEHAEAPNTVAVESAAIRAHNALIDQDLLRLARGQSDHPKSAAAVHLCPSPADPGEIGFLHMEPAGPRGAP